MSSQLESGVRIVGLSSSLTNAKDVGGWLGASSSSQFNFLPNTRPVPLELQIKSFNLSHTPSRLAAMVRPVYQAITNYAGKLDPKPALVCVYFFPFLRCLQVFVPSRRLATSTAFDIVTYAHADNTPQRFLQIGVQDLQSLLNAIQVSSNFTKYIFF